jgi:integrase/recombinase XerD
MNSDKLREKARLLFLEYESGRGLTEATVQRKRRELERFFTFLETERPKDLRDVTSVDIEEYVLLLKEKGFAHSTLGTSHSMLTDLFMALTRHELIMSNPMDLTEIIIREKAGAKLIFTEKEMEAFLDGIETVTGYGQRDRSLFELMYVSGMRVGEVVRLNVEDVDFSTNEVMIREGKGRKDRIVPLGKVAKSYLEKWIKVKRAHFLKEVANDGGALFLNENGGRISKSLVRCRMKHYLKACGIDKPGLSPHSIRHSVATHLLSNGADIIYVAELLGHESLVTTQIYTRQIVEGLKKTHKMYHPRENQLYVEADG